MNRLEIRNLKTFFFLDEGIVKAVNGVDLAVGDQETIGIIGESGCGKSVMSQSIMRLVQPPGEVVKGTALLHRKDGSTIDVFALAPNSPELRSIRGNEIAMIFQEPMTAFSPVYTIGHQISEMVALHTQLDKKRNREHVIGLLNRVGISNPSQRYDEYPHQLSGGMRQRAMIAMALSCSPKIILADEPTTALDVTIQAQILDLMRELQHEVGMSIVYITHNMAVIAETVERVYVMYLGQVVESATTQQLFANPLHPYTQMLLRSIPIDRPRECGFATRCPRAMSGLCEKSMPAQIEKETGHFVRCFLYSQETEPDDEWTNI